MSGMSIFKINSESEVNCLNYRIVFEDEKGVEMYGSCYTSLCRFTACLNTGSAVLIFMKFGIGSNQYSKLVHFNFLQLVMPHDGRTNIWDGIASRAPVVESKNY
jgi:hypothetical protein